MKLKEKMTACSTSGLISLKNCNKTHLLTKEYTNITHKSPKIKLALIIARNPPIFQLLRALSL
ncbi:hypothetical protein FEA34_12605 [Mannheimia haemolytica]|nr:hypothetical protein B824_25865 [Mannheimia haemolytica USDA-ARS-USMARC-184]TRC08413.1 hypothetical protein FEA39_02700 [Mannheimia haemolytica]TRC12297.1 hypothetical protein FEA50_09560 [Mannheimia haemolytica]TRC13681.1 hypothetical protein FEA43_00790 [Mannheimia haemolytica]TRC15013.1 hypothetical protein FEA23_11130 [Mannheimia haemolytica]